jgi:transcriptional regulator NrdR family protein
MFTLKKHHSKVSNTWVIRLNEGGPEKRVVKQGGSTEQYLRSKLASSVHKACVDATGFVGEAELTAENVCKQVEGWLEQKYEVTSSDIKRIAAKALQQYNPRAAYEYAPSEVQKLTKDDYGFIRL